MSVTVWLAPPVMFSAYRHREFLVPADVLVHAVCHVLLLLSVIGVAPPSTLEGAAPPATRKLPDVLVIDGVVIDVAPLLCALLDWTKAIAILSPWG